MNTALRFTSDPKNLCDIRKALRDFLDMHAFEEPIRELLVLAVDEACANIMRHAYCGAKDRPVLMRMEKRGDHIRILLRDFGKPCNPDAIRSRSLDDYRPGGLGVFLIRKAFHEVSYRPRLQGTELQLIRHFT